MLSTAVDYIMNWPFAHLIYDSFSGGQWET